MITLLSKLLIKNKDTNDQIQVRQAYGMLCGLVGIFLNLLLFVGKFLAGLLSNSIAITADALNNLSDAGSSIITLVGFKIAGQKPDPDHPFGHGRYEYLSGFIVALLILVMGFELIKSSVDKILHPEELIFSPLVLIILFVSILVKCYMAFYNHRIGKRIHSSAMSATAVDSLSDMVATSVVFIATLVSHFFHISIDGYCGVLVGGFVFFAGLRAAKETIDPLLGQAPDPEFVKRIQELVLAQEGIIGIHDLIVHNYGPGRILISLHAEVPADDDVLVMHDRIDLVEHELSKALHCQAVIHMDPVCVNDEETNHYKELTTEVLSTIDPVISMHDFRIVKGPTHTNLIFDVAVPYQFQLTDEALTSKIQEAIQEKDSTLFTVIEVDKLAHY